MSAVPERARATPATRRRHDALRESRGDTQRKVFDAAAHGFSLRGFDGITVDEIAAAGRVNKAMIYYHYKDKLTLYRAIVRDMLGEAAARLTAIARDAGPADQRLCRFIEAFMDLKDARPWLPTLMLREMSEGAPHLDLDTLGMMRNVVAAFSVILNDGQNQGLFRRDVQPILAYLSVISPLLMNAARERAAAPPGRSKLPMFVPIARADLLSHLQQGALRMLAKD